MRAGLTDQQYDRTNSEQQSPTNPQEISDVGPRT
jgi:hypothetical protein